MSNALSPRVTEYFARNDAAATWWDIDTSTGGRYGAQLAALRAHVSVRQGTRALDIATGRGRFAIDLAERGARVTAVDVSQAMLDLTRANALRAGVADRVDIRLGDAAELALAPASYDVVTLMEVLVHLPEPERVIAAAARALVPGGRLVTNYDTTAAPWITYPIDWYLTRRAGRQHVMHATVDETIAALNGATSDRPTIRPRDAYRGLRRGAVERMLERHGLTVVARQAERLTVKGIPIPVPVGYLVVAEKR